MKTILGTPILLLIFATAFWGGNAVVGKFALNYMSGIELSFLRWVLAFSLLFPFAIKLAIRDRVYYLQHFRFIAFLSLLSVSIYNTFQYLALQWTGAINVSVVAASVPAVIFAMTWLLGQERANTTQKSGLLLALIGVLYMAFRGEWARMLSLQFNQGDLLMFVAVVSWATYSVLFKKVPTHIDKLGLLLVQMFIGTLGILPFYFLMTDAGTGIPLNTPVLLILAYVAIFPSLLSFFFWNRAVLLGGANQAAMFCNLIPVFATLLAVLFLDEQFTHFHMVGMAVVFIGILLSTYGRKALT